MQRSLTNRSLMLFDSIHTSTESRMTSAFKHLNSGRVDQASPEAQYVTFDQKQSNMWAT